MAASDSKLQAVISLDKKYYMNTFGDRTPVCFEYGRGINLWDTSGRKYYDFFGGIAVNVLGHAHPALTEAIAGQASKLIHCSSLYYIEAQAKLAEILVKNSCADRVFFANSGAEANEGAFKLARMYFSKKGEAGKNVIITAVDSFHGRTLATVAATGQAKFGKYLKPLPPGFRHVPLNDIGALKSAAGSDTCAVMLEPIQGESGVHPANAEYLKAVREFCNGKGLLLIYDEVQSGMGRTGTLFGYQQSGIEPDIFTLAKGLGGGVPIGALCAKEFAAKAFEPGDHGSTFGGNPLACAAGIAVMETIIRDRLAENAGKMGKHLMNGLEKLKVKYTVAGTAESTVTGKEALIREIRGAGLMIGIEFSGAADINAVDIKNSLFNEGFIVGSIGEKVIRILPPLIVTAGDIDLFVKSFDSVLNKLL